MLTPAKVLWQHLLTFDSSEAADKHKIKSLCMTQDAEAHAKKQSAHEAGQQRQLCHSYLRLHLDIIRCDTRPCHRALHRDLLPDVHHILHCGVLGAAELEGHVQEVRVG